MGRSAILVLVLGLGMESLARADDEVSSPQENIILLPSALPEGFPGRLARRLTRELAIRLDREGYRVARGRDVALAVRATQDCAEPACFSERLAATQARLAARIRIQSEASGYRVAFQVMDLRARSVVADEEAECAGCSETAVLEVALSLVEGIEVPSEEAAPPVTTTPIPRPSEEAPAPVVVPPPERRESPRTEISPWQWVLGGGGVVLAGIGIPLVLIDGNVTCDGPRQRCPDVYDTLLGGSALICTGILMAVTAAVLQLLVLRESPSSSNGAFDQLDRSIHGARLDLLGGL